jgi:hypothetical protein
MKRYTLSRSTHVGTSRLNNIQRKSRLSSPFTPSWYHFVQIQSDLRFFSNEREVFPCMSGSDKTFRCMKIASDIAPLAVVYMLACKCTAVY